MDKRNHEGLLEIILIYKMKTILINYTNYNYWANKKICDLLITLDNSILEKELLSSFRTIKDTLYHIWDAENIWCKRINGESLATWPSAEFKGTFNEAANLFSEQSKTLIEIANKSSDVSFSEDITYKNQAGKEFTNKLHEILMHCLNHSTFHRGQIVTMLRTAGVTDLFSTDLITFYREQK
ncbi:MAG: DinB family protein [Bacteroidetes bacterium]|nr:DinB family protein [Bacteroidota bacterium]